jgi:hypothetical protein
MAMSAVQLFPTSGRVDETRQIGRSAAIARLHGRVGRGQHALLFGNRRIGKSSVSAAALIRVKREGGVGVDIDLSAGIADEHALVATLLTQAKAQQIGRTTAAAARTKGFRRRVDRARGLAELMQALGVDEAADLEHVLAALRLEDGAIDLRRVLGAIHADALISERSIVILVDEVQHLDAWRDATAVQSELARVMRAPGGPSFIFAGSERRPIERLFAAGRPLHEEGLAFSLPEIADREWEVGLIARFEEGGVRITADMVRGVLAVSDGHPQDTMRLCEHAYEWALQSPRREVDANVLARARAEAREHPSWGDR